MSSQPKHFFEFGPFRLDVQERLLMRHQDAIRLPPKAFETLLVLVENRGHLLAKQELMNKIWAETFVEEGNLAFHISTLRKVLDDLHEHPQYIVGRLLAPLLDFRFQQRKQIALEARHIRVITDLIESHHAQHEHLHINIAEAIHVWAGLEAD